MKTENPGDIRRWDGVHSGLQDWKVLEKATTVILTRLHGAERVCVWFSTEHGDEDEDDEDEDGDDEDEDEDDEDEGEDDFEEDEDESFIECKLAFYKPQMGVLLVSAIAMEKSFTVRSIAHSRDNRITMDRTVEMDWQCQNLYFGKIKNLEGNLPKNFNDYLQARGINGQLASFITKYAEEKEEQEKTEWHRTIETFISN